MTDRRVVSATDARRDCRQALMANERVTREAVLARVGRPEQGLHGFRAVGCRVQRARTRLAGISSGMLFLRDGRRGTGRVTAA